MKGMGRGKSHGPDGYIAEFFIHNWNCLKDVINEEIESIFVSNRMPSGWTDTKLVLIPKKEKAKLIKEFKRIAACNVIYKIVAKILANRIRSVLDKVISKEQVAFVPKRYIQKNILVVTEMVNSFYKSKASNPNIILKLDLEKAYDRTELEAIYKVMNLMDFPEVMIKWIKVFSVLNEDKRLWVDIHKSKHGEWHPWNEMEKWNESWTAKSIYKCMIEMREGMRIRIVNGKKAMFWRDPWLGELPLDKWPDSQKDEGRCDCTMLGTYQERKNGKALCISKDFGCGSSHLFHIHSSWISAS
ncbi:hypothetical protein Cni_G10771 [Canna indica]|uniref:Reverse transcriptase domain-containing protein n=1 Tax=Canna indica TaxID=4628 RepID=A0AAQ3K561_9LILI|nr:hypothetical protein Cni_G10771 [Canna indica]